MSTRSQRVISPYNALGSSSSLFKSALERVCAGAGPAAERSCYSRLCVSQTAMFFHHWQSDGSIRSALPATSVGTLRLPAGYKNFFNTLDMGCVMACATSQAHDL